MPPRFSLHHACIRVRDPAASVAYYRDHFGMRLLDVLKFPEAKFDLLFLGSLPDATPTPEPGTEAAHQFLWSFNRSVLELTHNYGTELEPATPYANGNVEPHRGFGHTGFIVDDVVEFCDRLLAAGVKFQKRPQDGRMKHIAFALDPDNYWVEILPRTASLPPTEIRAKPSFQQVMLRIKSPAASIPFYSKHFGMRLVVEKHFSDFSLYFMGSVPDDVTLADPTSAAAHDYASSISYTLLELTHNHGTENDPAFRYHNGNTEPRGFGHIAFLADELEASCAALEADGVEFTKRPHEGRMRSIAFVKDPDGYAVELVQRRSDVGGLA